MGCIVFAGPASGDYRERRATGKTEENRRGYGESEEGEHTVQRREGSVEKKGKTACVNIDFDNRQSIALSSRGPLRRDILPRFLFLSNKSVSNICLLLTV